VEKKVLSGKGFKKKYEVRTTNRKVERLVFGHFSSWQAGKLVSWRAGTLHSSLFTFHFSGFDIFLSDF
jgi:hypothetical protein